jgi:hypothetical protein
MIKGAIMRKLNKWDELVIRNGNYQFFQRDGVKNKKQKWSLTATSFGRTGIKNMAGINIRTFKVMLFGNLASGGIYETTS